MFSGLKKATLDRIYLMQGRTRFEVQRAHRFFFGLKQFSKGFRGSFRLGSRNEFRLSHIGFFGVFGAGTGECRACSSGMLGRELRKRFIEGFQKFRALGGGGFRPKHGLPRAQ